VDRSLLGEMGTNTGDNSTLVESEQFITNTFLDFSVDISGKPYLTVIFFDSLLTNEMVERLCGYFMNFIRCISDEPDSTAGKEVIMASEERQKILYEFNRTAADFPREKTIHQLFEEQVERTPDYTALVGMSVGVGTRFIASAAGKQCMHLIYRELNEKSNLQAFTLIEKGVRPDTIVGIKVERSLEMIIGIMGILKAGGAYLPIDPDYPQERINYMLADSGAKIVLTSDAINRVPTPNHLSFHPSTLLPFYPSQSSSLAYIIYTSGTTGKPKGSLIEHRNVVSLMVHDHYLFKFGSSDVWTMFHSYCFDFSVWEMYGALLYGGKLVIISRNMARDPQQNLQILKEQQVTVLNQTPSAFYQLAWQELESPGKNLRLRYVIFGGEALAPARLKPWKEKYPRTKLINMFGITETTVHVTYKEIDQNEIESNISNIGGPLPTLNVYIMDRNQKLQPIGAAGELFVGGAGVCRGYLNQPGLTAEKFGHDFWDCQDQKLLRGVQGGGFLEKSSPGRRRLYKTGDLGRWQPNGNIEYLGRIDHQVKIRGYRVELGEIEAQLMRHFAVKEAVALERQEPDGLKAMNVYVVPDLKYAYPVKQFIELEKQGRLENLSYHEYPNGMTIFYLNRHETDFMYREIFEEQSYIKNGITLEEGACIFDVGANIGMFSLFIHHTCKNSKIYAFEPLPPIFEVLILNTSIYGRNVEVLPWGLSQNESEAVFTYYPHAAVLSGRYADCSQETDTVKAYIKNELRENPKEEQLSENQVNELLEDRLKNTTFTCKMKSLSQVLREEGIERIDLLKIDVEKAEIDVLNGIDDTDWPKIRQMVLEVHNVDERLEKITQQLRQRGYRVVYRQDSKLKNTDLYNVYAVSEEKSPPGKQFPAPEKKQAGKTCDYYLSPRQFIDDIRNFLKEKVPEYIVPSHFFLIDHIPMNPNGKVDRKNILGSAIKTGKAYIAPRNREEIKLVEIWAEVLSLEKEKISIDENFFNIGGHSLKATVMVVKVQEAFHVQLPLVQVFKTPTIRGMVTYINQGSKEQMQPVNDKHLVMLKEGTNRDKPLFFIHDGTGDVEGYVQLCKDLNIDNRCWGIRAAPLENYTPVNISIENIAANYIRTFRKLQPYGPYCMAGWSLGGVIAFEMALQLETMGQKMTFLGLIDAPSPQKDGSDYSIPFGIQTEANLLIDYLPNNEIKEKVKNLSKVNEIWPTIIDYLEENQIDVDIVKPLIPDALARVIPNYDRVDTRDLIYYLNMHRTLVDALLRYIPKRPMETPIHYFKASQSPETVKKGWHDYCKKPLEIHQIEGDHFSILRKPVDSRMGEIFTAVFTSSEF
jgi:amino acid adenylation domain-containing protein/FkbM family methyltransferase